jgi:hypothetical protein
MKANKATKAIMTALLVLLMAGSAMCATYDESVTLENKVTATWTAIEGDGISAIVDYNVSGEEFEYAITGEGLQACMCYSLIYYADYTPTSGGWGGDNPGALIAEVCADQYGDISKTGSVELNMNLPEPPDYNMDPYDGNFCCGNNEHDYYEHCCGAKLWLVPYGEYNAPARRLTGWNPDAYLFETDMIWYDDTGHNIAPEIVDLDLSSYCVVAGEQVTIYADVVDMDGFFDLKNMVVEADLNAFGIEDSVNLTYDGMTVTYDGMTDCITATYIGNAIVTKATGCECDDSQGFNVTATDPTGETDVDNNCHMAVIPGPCDHLNFTPLSDYVPFEEMGITPIGASPLLVWESMEVNIDPGFLNILDWWDYYLYIGAQVVTCQDQYGNDLCEIGCDPIVSKSGHMSIYHDELIIPYEWDLPGTLVVYYNGVEAETGTLTAWCCGGNVTEAVTDIDFLEPIIHVNVSAAEEYLFHNGTCACGTDCMSVSAQILDENFEPILMPGVPVRFSTLGYEGAELDPNCTEWALTNDDGIATTELCIEGDVVGTVEVRAFAEGPHGADSVDVIEPVCDIQMFADPDELIKNDDCGSYECSCITGQLLDLYGMPVEAGGVPIIMEVNGDDWETIYTNEGGGIEITYCTEHYATVIGNNLIGAEGVECEYDGVVNITVDVPVLTGIEISEFSQESMQLCENREFCAECFDQSGDPMMCPELDWSVDSGSENVSWAAETTDPCCEPCNDLDADNLGTGIINVSDNISQLYATVEITVVPGDVDEVVVEQDTIELELCEYASFDMTCSNQYDCEIDCGDCTVSFDPEGIASYEDDDVLGVGVGYTEMTVSVGEASDTVDITVTDTIAPEVSVIAIEPDDCCIGAIISIYAFVDDCGNSPNALTVMANGETMTHDDEGVFWCDYVAQEGTNVVNVTATDPSGNANYDDTDNYTASNTPPEITMVSVTESTCPGSLIEIVVEVEDDCTDPEDLVVMAIIGENVIELEYGDSLFMGQVDAEEGIHYVNVTAEDEHDGLVYDDTQCYDATNLAPLVSGVMLSPTSCYTGDTITVNVTVSDDCTDVEDLIVKADGKNLTYTAGYFVGTFCAVEGTHNVTVSVWDELGEIGENDSAQYTATKKKSKKSPGGSSGGGIYPPGWGQSTNVTEPESDSDSGNGTYPDEPESSGQEESPDGGVVVTEPAGAEPPESGGILDGPQGNATDTPPCTGPFCPGFAGITGIIAILVMVLIARRRR